MPVPIQLINDRPLHQQDTGLKDMLNVLPSMLSDLSLLSKSMTKEAMASDRDADMLFKFWENSQIIKEADRVSDRLYAVPQDFSMDEIMSLKTNGLIVGDTKQIKITDRGAKVIRSLVLGESNQYEKQAIKKPYSLILAESKPKRKSGNLAFASNNICLTAETIVTAAPVKHDKVYIVRVYENPNTGGYDVWSFNGKYGAKLHPHPKGSYPTYGTAEAIAKSIINTKKAGAVSSDVKTSLSVMVMPQKDSEYMYEARLRHDSAASDGYINFEGKLPNGAEPPGIPIVQTVEKFVEKFKTPKAPKVKPQKALKTKPSELAPYINGNPSQINPPQINPPQINPQQTNQTPPPVQPKTQAPTVIDSQEAMVAAFQEWAKNQE